MLPGVDPSVHRARAGNDAVHGPAVQSRAESLKCEAERVFRSLQDRGDVRGLSFTAGPL